jgi:N-acetylmuramoyl-L-alanine amidase
MRLGGRRGAAGWVAALVLFAAGLPAGAGTVQAQELELLAPKPAERSTTREFVNVLGRVAPGSTVRVAGEPAVVFSSGIFVRDRVPVVLGPNRIEVTATAADGPTQSRVLEVERIAPPAPPPPLRTDRLAFAPESLRPALALRVAPGEAFEVAAHATPGQRVQVRLPGEKRWRTLPESPAGSGRYRAPMVFDAAAAEAAAAPVEFRLLATTLPRSAKPRVLLAKSVADVGLWRADPARLFVAGPDGADLLHGTHEVRLGGPSLAEVPPGTLLLATGQRGEHVRMPLSPDTTAWVLAKSLAPAAAGAVPPAVHFTTLSLAGSPLGDVLTVPLSAPVPYAVRAVADGAGRMALEIDIFGAHHATTWITHRASAAVVREVTAEQAGPGRVRVRVQPHAARLWGWRVERTATSLRVTLVPTPAQFGTPTPLAGLRIALEAGHGSDANRGAVGATGVPEKDFNRWTAEALKTELDAAGALVAMVREADANPSLRERVRRADEAGAQLYISMHANAADTAGGYLRVSGTSTYYKHTTGRDLAAAVQKRLLAETSLPDFGLVGNFNYTPIRVATGMPAILVEQAFVSHPGDEAALLDPAFRLRLARAVKAGIEDFMRGP